MNLLCCILWSCIIYSVVGDLPDFKNLNASFYNDSWQFPVEGRALLRIKFRPTSHRHHLGNYQMYFFCVDGGWKKTFNPKNPIANMKYLEDHSYTSSEHRYHIWRSSKEMEFEEPLDCNRYQGLLLIIYHRDVYTMSNPPDQMNTLLMELNANKEVSLKSTVFGRPDFVFTVKTICYPNYSGKFCQSYCEENKHNHRSICENGSLRCKKGFTGDIRSINYHFYIDDVNKLAYHPEIVDKVWVQDCHETDYCNPNPCGEYKCILYAEGYICEDWVRPHLGGDQYYYTVGDPVFCIVNSDWNQYTDAPLMLTLYMNPCLAIDADDPSLGVIKGGLGKTKIICGVAVKTEDELLQTIHSEAKEIELYAATDICRIFPVKWPRSPFIIVNVDEEILFQPPDGRESAFKLQLSMFDRVDENNVILGKNSLKFLPGAPPGVYTVTCMLYMEKKGEVISTTSEHSLLYIGESAEEISGSTKWMLAGDTFECDNELLLSNETTATLFVFKSLKGLRNEKNYLLTTEESAGKTLIGCALQSGDRSYHAMYLFTLQICAAPTTVEIVPNPPQMDAPIFCVTNAYPSELVNIYWNITDAKDKQYAREEDVLFLSDIGAEFEEGSTIRIQCSAIFTLNGRHKFNAASIRFKIPAKVSTFMLNYKDATLSLILKMILILFCFASVILMLLAMLLPVLLPLSETSPLNALNYHVRARLQEQARRRGLTAANGQPDTR